MIITDLELTIYDQDGIGDDMIKKATDNDRMLWTYVLCVQDVQRTVMVAIIGKWSYGWITGTKTHLKHVHKLRVT